MECVAHTWWWWWWQMMVKRETCHFTFQVKRIFIFILFFWLEKSLSLGVCASEWMNEWCGKCILITIIISDEGKKIWPKIPMLVVHIKNQQERERKDNAKRWPIIIILYISLLMMPIQIVKNRKNETIYNDDYKFTLNTVKQTNKNKRNEKCHFDWSDLMMMMMMTKKCFMFDLPKRYVEIYGFSFLFSWLSLLTPQG